MNDGAILGIDVDEARIDKRLETGCDRKTHDLDEALRWIREATDAKQRLSVDWWATRRRFSRVGERGITPDVLTDQTSAHDTLVGCVPAGLSLDAAAELRTRDPSEYVRRANASIVEHEKAMLAMQERARSRSITGTTFDGRAGQRREERIQYSGFVPECSATLCRREGTVPLGRAPGDPADIARTDDPCSSSSRTMRT